MDVAVKVSLQGGHVWEFTCDEGDPMVFGLVSALPGAAVDSALPPDGLVQVEARSGERMYLTRSSLVAVTISRLGHGPSSLFGDTSGSRPGTTVPASFALVPECFETETLADLRTAIARAKTSSATSGAAEVNLKNLPEMAAAGLVAAIAEARATLALVADEDTHLDVRLYAAGVDALAPAAEHTGKDDIILSFLILLPLQESGTASGTVELHDRLCGPTTGEAASARAVTLLPNTALVFPAGAKRGPLQLTAQSAEALVVSGNLRRGAAGERR